MMNIEDIGYCNDGMLIIITSIISVEDLFCAPEIMDRELGAQATLIRS